MQYGSHQSDFTCEMRNIDGNLNKPKHLVKHFQSQTANIYQSCILLLLLGTQLLNSTGYFVLISLLLACLVKTKETVMEAESALT